MKNVTFLLTSFVVVVVVVVSQLGCVDARPMAKLSEIDTTKNLIKKTEEDTTVVIDNTTNQLRVRKTDANTLEEKKEPKNNALLKSGGSRDADSDYDDDDYDYVAPIINIKFKRSAEDNRTNRIEKVDNSQEEVHSLQGSTNSQPLEIKSNSSLTKSHRRKNRRRKQRLQKENNS